MKILVIGNFNEKDTRLVNGQTLKSDLIYKALCEIKEYQIERLNTNILKKEIFNILFNLKKNDKVIVMLGQNGMKYLFPFIYLMTKILKKDLFYIVIGGWLSNFLERNTFLKKMLKKIRKILVESDGMKQELKNIGVTNVEVLYNFRDENDFFSENNIKPIENKEYIRSIFLSRVIKEKGVYDLIKVVKEINKKKKQIILDIYGPLNEKEKLMKELDKNIKYKGVVEQKEVYSILRKYDLMIFPTYYKGEGQAGVIIEAILSEIPILASNWRFNHEFIKDNETGFLYEACNNLELKRKIEYLIMNKNKLKIVKNNLLTEKEKFTKKNFKKQIRKILNN